jgi:carboxyl-terminal processing protease
MLFLFCLCVIGFKLEPIKAYAQEKYAELQNFSKVLNIIQQYYVDSVDSKKLIQGAMKGMLKELDPHTSYMPPEVFKDFENETSGEFGGIGIEISIVNGILTIISPIEDTPAWIAGIKPGDKVISINGQTTKNVTLVEASLMMRGKNNEVINLSVIRGSEEKMREFKINRGVVKIKSVKSVDLENG